MNDPKAKRIPNAFENSRGIPQSSDDCIFRPTNHQRPAPHSSL